MQYHWSTVLLGLAAGAQAQKLFTVNCQPVSQQRADPVIFPGQVSPHVHAVVGSTAFAQNETNQQAIKGVNTTCDKYLDHSSYWEPQLYHQNSNGSFTLLNFQGSAVYYLNRACNYTAGLQSCPSTYYAQAPPAGLRMVAGNPYLRTYNASDPHQQAISHECLQQNTSFQQPGLPNQACLRLRSQVFFPSCWDGVNLDSADHQSHMAYPAVGTFDGGVCPSDHPVAIYSVFFEWYYDTSPFPDYQNLVYAMGDPTGYGLHGDYIQGWTDQTKFAAAMRTCTGQNGVNDPNCSLNGPNGPGTAHQYTTQTPAYNEDIGLHGPVKPLPGNNPVTRRKAKRQEVPKVFTA